ncbi:putative membrane protein [Pseudaminobacter salicylatoxidans]|uniref:Putative membrane protein n=1 Tax=Pseudaminobacter salicylatoxidans TaxID=93369 RepID=A0A316C6J7_PSESE|nr:pilus assembly protein TadG-related protein [Pseudaminobacter salicylatoxidans]PWJ85385.1 putative membrane protein [Pseudaminobacter salicylatoxidans]
MPPPGHFLSPGKSFFSNTSGNFAIMSAACLPVALVLAAVAIDEGSLYTERRAAQSIVDLAAITAAANLDKAETAVTTVFADNGISGVTVGRAGTRPPVDPAGFIKPTVNIEPGRYTGLATSAVGTRFSPGAKPYNAVRVTFAKNGTRHFGSALISPPVIATQATASVSAQAAFSIGSRLASLDGGILNQLLGDLTGSNLKLNLMDYRSLIDADVNLLSVFDQLNTRLKLNAASYTDVLGADVTVGQLVAAMAAVPGTDSQAKVVLDRLAGVLTGTAKVPLRALVDLGSTARVGVGQTSAGLPIVANVMEILTASAVLANGKNQVATGLKVNVLGLAGATVDIAIGEPPQSTPFYTVGETGALVRTAQTRIRIEAAVSGLGLLGDKLISLPVYADIAYAEGRLAEISCSTGRVESVRVKVDTTPGVADLRIGDVNSAMMKDFSRKPTVSPAKLVDVSLLGLGLISIHAQARAAVENIEPTKLSFTYQDITDRTIKTAHTKNLTSSLTRSLLGDLHLEARTLLGLKIGVPSGIASALGTTLGAVTAPVDSLLMNVLGLLGVRVGEADVRVEGATCGRSVLVQ